MRTIAYIVAVVLVLIPTHTAIDADRCITLRAPFIVATNGLTLIVYRDMVHTEYPIHTRFCRE